MQQVVTKLTTKSQQWNFDLLKCLWGYDHCCRETEEWISEWLFWKQWTRY